MSGPESGAESRTEAQVFLLSPASPRGARARQLASRRARFATAERFRSPEGVPLAEAFSFLSALYFRGKITYAQSFARPPAALAGEGVWIIAPGFGLVPPEWALTVERWRRLRRTPVDLASRAYTRPLALDAAALAARLGAARAVLLGSVATGKYVDLLRPVFGDRLVFPRCFAGLGDMSRGSLLLRAAASGVELDYATLDAPRRRPQSSPC
jgi:hypothetical protein